MEKRFDFSNKSSKIRSENYPNCNTIPIQAGSHRGAGHVAGSSCSVRKWTTSVCKPGELSDELQSGRAEAVGQNQMLNLTLNPNTMYELCIYIYINIL